jgi:hypothetical protein
MKKVVKDVEVAAKEVAGKVEKKAGVVKEVVKEEVKSGVKKAATATKKTAARKAVKETVVLQYLGKEINKDDLMKQIREIWTKQMKRKVSDLVSVTLYLKPEDNMVYYVINDEVTGSIAL